MVTLGYLYVPALIESPDPAEPEQLKAAGAETIYLDWGSRIYYPKLQAQAETGELTDLYLKRLDDLGDTVAEIHQRILRLTQAGIQLHLVEETGSSTLQTSLDWIPLLANLPGSLQSRRIRQHHHRNRLDHKPPPGPAPYGYRRESDRYILDRRQAVILKDFFDHFLLYGSLRESVRYLAEKHQKRISVSTGHRWLTHPVYRGDLHFKDGSTLRNTHSPILSRTEAAQIDRWLRRHQTIPARSVSAPRSLAGLVFCSICQHSMRIVQVTSGSQSTPYLYLRCQSCRYSLDYTITLHQIIHQICHELPERGAHFDPAPLEQAKSQLEDHVTENETILDELKRLVQAGWLDPISIQQRRYQLEAENAEILERLNQLPPQNLPEIISNLSIEPFWLDLTESERRSYFREFLHSIHVDPDGGIQLFFVFDPS